MIGKPPWKSSNICRKPPPGSRCGQTDFGEHSRTGGNVCVASLKPPRTIAKFDMENKHFSGSLTIDGVVTFLLTDELDLVLKM